MLLDVPVRATEQYPVGLGPTVGPLSPYPEAVLAKTAFSALDDPDFPALLPVGSAEIVVAGCEAHVCVLHTLLGLLGAGHRVVVVADATGSRDPEDKYTYSANIVLDESPVTYVIRTLSIRFTEMSCLSSNRHAIIEECR